MGIVARQAIRNTVFTYLGIGLGFVNVVLLYPRVLDSDQFGLTRLLLSVGVIAAQVAQLGAENTVVRYFPYFRDPQRANRGLLGMLLVFGTAVGLLAVLVLGALHGVLADVFADRNALYGRYGLFVLPLVLSEVFFILLRSYSRSLHRTVQPIFIREFVLRLAQTLIIGVQWFRPMPFGWFMVLYTAVFLCCTLALALDLHRAGLLTLGWKHRWLPGRLRRSMGVYGGYTLLSGLAGIALGNLDQLMIGALLSDGLKYVAYYAVGFYFGSVIAAPTRALQQVAMPLLADAWKRDDRAAIAALYKRSSLVQTMVAGFLLLLLWASVGDLFSLLPTEYAPAANVALLIGSAYFINSVSGLNAGMIGMSRAYRVEAWSNVALLLVSLVGNIFMIGRLGPVGAAWTSMFALVLVNGFRTAYLWKRFGLWPFGKDIVIVVSVLVGFGVAVRWLPLSFGAVGDMAVRTALLAVVFWPLMYWLGPASDLARLVHLHPTKRGPDR